MSEELLAEIATTQHAFLVMWGNYVQEIGLISRLEAVPIAQRTRDHTPQSKVIEILLAILSGTAQFQDISRAAHPLSKDQAAAKAWNQPGFADASGVSRTLQRLDWETVEQLDRVFWETSAPLLEAEIRQELKTAGRLVYDGDLTGLPVSNCSTGYPNAAYGYMAAEVRLGYQAGLVSLSSSTYGRLWLAVEHHPGDTVSATQAGALVLAAEARTGRRPRRRTELIAQRLRGFYGHITELHAKIAQHERKLHHLMTRYRQLGEQVIGREREVAELAARYTQQQQRERPTSRLALVRQRLETTHRQQRHQAQAILKAEHQGERLREQRRTFQQGLETLQQRLEDFERENDANPNPIQAEFRVDAGFGTYENLALLIEMGYEVYTKPHGGKLALQLKKETDDLTPWTRVGSNAKMVAWSQRTLNHCPYPVDVALERFHAGKQLKYSALFHYGDDPVGANLPLWFNHYNQRQTIEARIKETKQVFYLQRIKVRSEPAIYLQECAVVFAANFIRFAQKWISDNALPAENSLPLTKMGVKRQVRVGAQVSAFVTLDSDSWLLRFTPQSCFANQTLRLPAPPGVILP